MKKMQTPLGGVDVDNSNMERLLFVNGYHIKYTGALKKVPRALQTPKELGWRFLAICYLGQRITVVYASFLAQGCETMLLCFLFIGTP